MKYIANLKVISLGVGTKCLCMCLSTANLPCPAKEKARMDAMTAKGLYVTKLEKKSKTGA